MSREQDQKYVDDFFEKYGHETVAEYDMGYGCTSEVSINCLYDIFVTRMHLEKEFDHDK